MAQRQDFGEWQSGRLAHSLVLPVICTYNNKKSVYVFGAVLVQSGQQRLHGGRLEQQHVIELFGVLLSMG